MLPKIERDLLEGLARVETKLDCLNCDSHRHELAEIRKDVNSMKSTNRAILGFGSLVSIWISIKQLFS